MEQVSCMSCVCGRSESKQYEYINNPVEYKHKERDIGTCCLEYSSEKGIELTKG